MALLQNALHPTVSPRLHALVMSHAHLHLCSPSCASATLGDSMQSRGHPVMNWRHPHLKCFWLGEDCGFVWLERLRPPSELPCFLCVAKTIASVDNEAARCRRWCKAGTVLWGSTAVHAMQGCKV
jgi:hypothetical protein